MFKGFLRRILKWLLSIAAQACEQKCLPDLLFITSFCFFLNSFSHLAQVFKTPLSLSLERHCHEQYCFQPNFLASFMRPRLRKNFVPQ